MHRGYVKVWRKMEDSGILQDQGACQFFLWALFKATHRPRKQIIGNQVVNLQPGQFVSGRNSASSELGISPSKFNRTLEKMKMLEFVDTKANNKFTVFTIANWATYQSEQTASGQQAEQQADSKRTASGQQADTNKNVKNLRIKKEDSLRSSSCPEPHPATGPTTPQVSQEQIPAVIAIPVKGKAAGDYAVTEADIAEWQEAFPGVDVLQALRSIRQWNLAHPTRQKTMRGIRAHIVSWLDREQNKAGARGLKQSDGPPNTSQARVVTGDRITDANIATAERVLLERAKRRAENARAH